MSRYFTENEEDQNPENFIKPSHQLVEGINLKNLLKGENVVFQLNEEYDCDILDNFEPDEPLTEIKKAVPSEKLRGSRGAPLPDQSFESIAAGMENVDKNGFVKKEIIIHGTGNVAPDHSRIVIHYNLYKEFDEEPFDSTHLRGRPLKLRLDVGEMLPGLEIAVKSMKKKENSRFLIKWQAAFGRQGVPPRIGKECDILADVTLLEYTPLSDNPECLTADERNALTFEQNFKEAKHYHCSGNDEFAADNIKGAIKKYSRCVNILNGLKLWNEEEESKMLSLKIKCMVNLAICYNKSGRSERACLVCRDVLSIEPENVKAVFQYGKANMNLSNLKLAEKWLLKARRMKPEDKDINAALDQLDQKKKMTELEDLLFCQRAFENLNVKEVSYNI